LIQGLAAFNLGPEDITDVFLTHIHLDHAGSAGWWAQQGARIHVHKIGAPHMINPEKLLASASRIYGDLMGTLWGDFLPVPEEKISPVQDSDLIPIDGLSLRALDTPGHANHHISYLLNGVCFCGDIGGVHMQGIPFVRLPSVPPEFDPVKWRQSISRFKTEKITAFAPTHFGIHQDAAWHLSALENALDEIETWMEEVMPTRPSPEALREKYASWMDQRSLEAGISPEVIAQYNLAISSEMSADGIYRYWNKVRNA
jgi:glyoxylase-like metal-dependent hydrolase (beta-lactamase superfamily II)